MAFLQNILKLLQVCPRNLGLRQCHLCILASQRLWLGHHSHGKLVLLNLVKLVRDYLNVLVCFVQERIEELHLAIHRIVSLLLQYVRLHRLTVAHRLRLFLLARNEDLLVRLLVALAQGS